MYLCVNIYTLKFGPVWVKDLWQSTWCKKRRNVQPSHEQNEKLDHHQNLAHLWSPVDAPPSSKKGRDNKSLHLRTKYGIHSLFILMQIIDHITTIPFFFYPLWTIVSFNQMERALLKLLRKSSRKTNISGSLKGISCDKKFIAGLILVSL